ncbi:ArsB/NhaD family transporter [Nocardioides sp.]|uniref:ArsB/NhaD family transporter n=1 Tax=Nocardioides sp. TaxID=35761 RepID=UPI001A253EFD|nr:ArsB/NhaD family transporter [Nocardioides sp.]MBJ7356514.1 ArsB/NhaD family transporter [Nocardioides sp.]
MDAVLAVTVFVGAYAFLVADRVHRTKVALVGAGLVLLLHISDAEAAFFDEESGVEWNVVFLLLGMMVIVSVLRQTGVFEYVAIYAAKRSRGRAYRLMVMLCVLTATASAVLDNVTTVLLVAPVTFLVCDRLGLRPVPFLIAEVLASNIGGAATLVGDPPNIIIASRADLTFNDFLVNMAPWVVVLMVVFCLMCRVLFRTAFVYDPERADAVMLLDEREAITDKRLLVTSLIVLAGVVAAFVLHPVLHYEPSVVALLGAGILVLVTRVEISDALSEVEWPTLAFFGGLFIMVGGLVETGVIEDLSTAMADRTDGDLGLASMVLLFGSAVLSAIVDNIPYVATMSPVVVGLVPTMPGNSEALWWSLAFGADLGGNATAIGASANVVMLGLAEKAGHRIGFWEFTKYGLVVTVVTVGLTAPYIALRYL